MNEPHVPPTSGQMAHEHTASMNRAQLASVNHGRPATFAMARPMNRPEPDHYATPQNRPPQNVKPQQPKQQEYRRPADQRREGQPRPEHPREDHPHDEPK